MKLKAGVLAPSEERLSILSSQRSRPRRVVLLSLLFCFLCFSLRPVRSQSGRLFAFLYTSPLGIARSEMNKDVSVQVEPASASADNSGSIMKPRRSVSSNSLTSGDFALEDYWTRARTPAAYKGTSPLLPCAPTFILFPSCNRLIYVS